MLRLQAVDRKFGFLRSCLSLPAHRRAVILFPVVQGAVLLWGHTMSALRRRSFLACGAILAAVLIGQSLLPGAPAPPRPAIPGEKLERRVFHLKRLSPTGAAETVRTARICR